MNTQILPAFQLSGTLKVTLVQALASHLTIREFCIFVPLTGENTGVPSGMGRLGRADIQVSEDCRPEGEPLATCRR